MTTAPPVTYTLPMQRDVAAFHDAFGMPNLIGSPGALPADRIDLRLKLIREEGVAELRDAIRKKDPVLIIDALIDTVYVTLGTFIEMGQLAGDLVSFDRRRGELNVDVLMDTAEALVISNEMYLNILESALRRGIIDRAVEILDTITTSALYTLLVSGVDPQPFFDEVHRANMSKHGVDDGGKAVKGADYAAPNLGAILTLPQHTKAPTGMSDFERGARAAAEAFHLYFLDENEAPMYYIDKPELTTFEEGAVADALRDEELRIQRAG